MEMTTEIQKTLSTCIAGVYLGKCRLNEDAKNEMAVLSIGYNPYYENENKTCVNFIYLGSLYSQRI